MLLLIRPTLDADSASEVGKQTGELITANAGSIDSTNMWGRRKLAYQIDNFNEATYTLIKFKLDPAKLRDLEFELKLNDSLLRYLIIRDLHPQSTELQDDEASEDKSEASNDGSESAVSETVAEVTEVVSEAAEAVVEGVESAVEAAGAKATEVAEAVSETVAEVTEAVSGSDEDDSTDDSSEKGSNA